MYEKQLTKAGLTTKQATIYEACLVLDKAKAPQIAKKADIKRSTTYAVLDELISLGLISYSTKGKTRYYKAQNPQALLEILEARKANIERILPDLENLCTGNTLQPRVQFFEGKEGIKRIYEDTLQCKSKKLCQIIRVRDFIDFPGNDFSKKYITERVKRGITVYALHPNSGDIYNDMYGKESQAHKRYVRYLPPSMFYASMIMIYDNKVAMISTRKENFGFIIESKEFASTLHAQFNFLWQMGSRETSI